MSAPTRPARIVAVGFPCVRPPGPWSIDAHRPPHRVEVLSVILGCITDLALDWYRVVLFAEGFEEQVG